MSMKYNRRDGTVEGVMPVDEECIRRHREDIDTVLECLDEAKQELDALLSLPNLHGFDEGVYNAKKIASFASAASDAADRIVNFYRVLDDQVGDRD